MSEVVSTTEDSNAKSNPSLGPVPSVALHTPEGEEEKPLCDDDLNAVVPLVDLPPPPDGGWGWVICFSSFMCNLILDGIAYTFGVLLEPLVSSFDSNRSTISWVGSLLAGVYLTSGPIVGGLVNKFGCRPVCIAGSLVSCLGLALSTLSPNVPVLMLTYGVIGGFGLGLIYLPAVVAVGYYFEKRRALATGISVCGSGVGTFIFAPLATFLLDVYGWKGANLIFAGLCLNCAVFGALMRPLELTVRHEKEDDETKKNLQGDFTVQLPDGTQQIQFEDDVPPTFVANTSFHQNHEEISAASPSINMAHLPTIAENSITKPEKNEHRSVQDVFPSEHPQRPRRKRTTSENAPSTSKFQVTPVRNFKVVDGMIPRNSTAPNFVDTSMIIPRNSSTPGFGRLARLSSQTSNTSNDFQIYGLHGSQLLSNTTLHLEPQSPSRRGSRPIIRPMYRKDVFYSGSVSHLIHSESRLTSANPSFANFEEYRHSILSIPRVSRRQSTFSIPRSSIVASHLSIPPAIRKASMIDGDAIESDGGKPIWAVLKEMLNLDLMRNKYFLLIGLSNVFGMLGFYTPFVYLPDMAAIRGVEINDANFLISIIGISNTVGRVAAGWISDFEWVNSLLVTNLAIFFSGVCVFVLPWCQSYTSYIIIALLFGVFVAAYISLTSIVLVDLLGLDNLTSAFGLLVLFRGASSMIGPPVAGSVFDSTQSYDVSFYLAGVFLMVAAAISGLADLLHRSDEAKKEAKLAETEAKIEAKIEAKLAA